MRAGYIQPAFFGYTKGKAALIKRAAKGEKRHDAMLKMCSESLLIRNGAGIRRNYFSYNVI